MRLPLVVLFGLSFFSSSAFTQTSSTPLQSAANDAQTVALQAVAAFSASPVAQIQLTGTAKAYAGSSQPVGTFTATLQSTGDTKLQLNIGGLSRTETAGAFATFRQCQWTGQDGAMHDMALHNCTASVNWLIPVFDLQLQLTKLAENVTAEDQGAAVQALSLSYPPGDTSPSAALLSRLSDVKLSLDQSTFLPRSLFFNIHPDNDDGLDIPIAVRYSDYRNVNGVTLPYHIQKYLNNGLVLDVEVENAEVQ